MNWILFAITSLLLASLSNVLQSAFTKRSSANAMTVMMVSRNFTNLLLVSGALLFFEVSISDLSGLWHLVLIGSLLFPLSFFFAFQALKYLDTGVHIIIYSSGVLITVIGSTFFLGEAISLYQWIGLMLILSGVAAIRLLKTEHVVTKNGITLAVIAAFLYGIGNIVEKPVLDATDVQTFLVVTSMGAWIGATIMYLLYQLYNNKPLLPSKESIAWKLLLGAVVIRIVSEITYFVALSKLDNVSRLSAVNTFSIIITVVLGIILLNEKNNIKLKLAASAVATLGFLLLLV